MGMMKFEIPHSLSKDDARKRVEQLVHHWGSKYGVKVDWAGDRAKLAGKVMGLTIDGHLEVQDKRIAGEATDPGFLFREKAKKYLHERLTKALDPKGGGVHED